MNKTIPCYLFICCRQHLLDSESQLINRCFSTWRQHTTSVLYDASQHFLSNLLQRVHSHACGNARSVSSDSLGTEGSSLTQVGSSDTDIPHSRSSVDVSAWDKLGYLQGLSREIENNLLSSHKGEDTAIKAVDESSNSFQKQLVEKKNHEPSLTSEHTSSTCSSTSSWNSSITLCSCLEPTVLQKIHDLQERLTLASANATPSCAENKTNSNSTEHHDVLLPRNYKYEERPLQFHALLSPSYKDTNNFTTALQFSVSQNALTDDSTARLVSSAACCIRNMRLYPCNRAFYQWLAFTRKTASLRQRSNYIVRLFRLRRQRKCFDVWRGMKTRTVALKLLAKDCQDRAGLMVTRSFFHLWQQRTERDVQSAERNERNRRLRSALNQWKKCYQMQSVTQENSEKVLRYF